MTSMSMNRTRDSPFRESEWDRRLDDMLEDLGGGQGLVTRPGGGQVSVMLSRIVRTFENSIK